MHRLGAAIGVATSWLALALCSQAGEISPQAGLYHGELRLAIDPITGGITGAFSSATGGGQFSCAFMLQGDGHQAADGTFRIMTWWPYHWIDDPKLDDEVAPGSLRFTTEPFGPDQHSTLTAVLKVQAHAHGGCWNVDGALDSGAEDHLPLIPHGERTRWLQIRQVSAAKARLHAGANGESSGRAYVVKGDVVAVVARTGGWSHVEYTADNGHITKGWIKGNELFPAAAPAQ